MVEGKEHHDHSVTYKTKSITHITHRFRLKELNDLTFRVGSLGALSGYLYDFGGAAGYWGDTFSKLHPNLVTTQIVLDAEHPENSSRKTWHQPTLPTEYVSFNLNDTHLDYPIRDGSLLVCSETLEHVADPLKSLSELYKLAQASNSLLIISVPIEHGFIGVFKCVARLILGRNRGKGFYHNTAYLLWSIGLGSNKFRGVDKLAYGDHDGFDSKGFQAKINLRYSSKNLQVFSGKSTFYAIFDFRKGLL